MSQIKAPKIVQREKEEVPAEILAQSIVDIARGFNQLMQSRLTRYALVVLIHDKSKIAKRDIEIILNNLEQLEQTWFKPKKVS